ncbi:hypothetical protein C0V97_11165 [Asaia sp. W19]|nr:hypothetical protein C0V97_11165 [Asaia sp. W19]
MRKRINFNGMTYFIAVIEAGSVTGAARITGVSKSVISKAISDLEASLQTDLLLRTSKGLLPTRAGEAFYHRCLAGMEAIETAFLDAEHHGSLPRGELRVLANAAYGRYRVLPVIHAFAERYPECKISFTLADDVSDLKMTWFDVAIRTRPLSDPSLHVRRIGSFQRHLVIGHDLASRSGVLDSFEKLSKIPFIGYVNHLDQPGWEFTRGLERRHVSFEPCLLLGPMNLVLESVMQGRGFSVLPSFFYEDPALAPRLKRLMPEWAAESGSILAYTYPTRQRSAAVRLFVEWMACAAQGVPFPDPGSGPNVVFPDPLDL